MKNSKGLLWESLDSDYNVKEEKKPEQEDVMSHSKTLNSGIGRIQEYLTKTVRKAPPRGINDSLNAIEKESY
tara:strand:- start:1364 stop:1579 length:216 start_codon:yes stop_codon:yes gene_type:complete